MSIINEKFPDLESSSKLIDINRFETIDINSFISGKSLVIEKVEVDEHIKFDVRITSDNTLYKEEKDKEANLNKVLTLQVDDSVANDINIVNIIGCEIILKNLSNEDATIYGNNALKVKIKDFTISPEKIEGFKQKNNLTVADHRLSKINQYKTFDAYKFLKLHQMKILTIYAQSPTTARIIAIITDDKKRELESNKGKTFSIKIEMPKVRDIPLELLIGNKPFSLENVKGTITGMIVKNNQVLLSADAFEYKDGNEIYSIGSLNESNPINKDANKNLSNSSSKDINTISNNSSSKELNRNTNNDVNNNVSNYSNNDVNKITNNNINNHVNKNANNEPNKHTNNNLSNYVNKKSNKFTNNDTSKNRFK
ncbi:hypothetical protein V074_02595 [Staphylococcus aureus 2010-60-1240-1]|uniref:hypothetical protein n=1 Tax=Staphylococcus aureus TaxID=1280 RepID=UPI00044E1E3E|nr:hypothetical protein [Staphylococcus aureus]EZV57640.1 hypothetical protein V074_02595 [Staphylococcus aureus 2010-60-1240-1]